MLVILSDIVNICFYLIFRVIFIWKSIIFYFKMKLLRFREVEWFVEIILLIDGEVRI